MLEAAPEKNREIMWVSFKLIGVILVSSVMVLSPTEGLYSLPCCLFIFYLEKGNTLAVYHNIKHCIIQESREESEENGKK